ncbi:phage tail assembly chaperone [Paenibacillus humicus]|uniref:phage tail assembly chaperone n=1 Tax=Paenibacillus humicus TaxID=412861 RepID=UPI000FDAAD08|nr:hypothetical protein [Paenibacillus humicus]
MATATKFNALQALLGATLKQELTVYIPRLGGNFTVRSLTSDELSEATVQATIPGPKGTKSLDDRQFQAAVIVKASVDPDFNDKALQDHYKASDALDCVGKALLPGEIAKVLQAVMDASGFGDDEELLEEAKN